MNIVFVQFQRLLKEICWLQFLFHSANYPMIYRNLRYILEMMSQAYYIDWEYPGLNLDKQIEKIMRIEETIFGWRLVKRSYNHFWCMGSLKKVAYPAEVDPPRIILSKGGHAT
jgi:hypothetical protein